MRAGGVWLSVGMVCWAGQGPRPGVDPGGLSQYLTMLSRLAQARQGQGPGPRRAEEGAS